MGFQDSTRQCCQGKWRLGSESNRRTRSCSPLHDHSATEPLGGVGAGNRVRTGDLNLGKVALYQLSYSRTSTFNHRRGRRNRRGCAPRHNLGKVALYQLSYSRTSAFNHRRGRRNRRGCAPRHNLGKVALYQLSYSRTSAFNHRRGRRNRRGCAPRHNLGKVALYQLSYSRTYSGARDFNALPT